MSTAGAGGVEIVPASDDHASVLADFFRKTWDPHATAASVLASRQRCRDNPVDAGNAYPTYLALVDGAVGAYLTSIPVRFWIGAQEVPGWWGKGLMVLPHLRNGPLGVLLVREQAKALPVLGSLAVNPAALRLFKSSGLQEVGALPNRLLPLRPKRMLALLDGRELPLDGLPALVKTVGDTVAHPVVRPLAGVGAEAVGGVWRAWRALRRPRGYSIERVEHVPADVDGLWEGVRGRIAAGVVRDGLHFRDRYGDPVGPRYDSVALRRDGTLVGYAVLRRPRSEGEPRLGGVRVGVVSEAMFDPDRPRDGLALLAAAEEVSRAAGADALLVSATHNALDGLAKRYGFLSLPANINYLVRLPETSLPPLHDWWLTRGDGGADDAF